MWLVAITIVQYSSRECPCFCYPNNEYLHNDGNFWVGKAGLHHEK